MKVLSIFSFRFPKKLSKTVKFKKETSKHKRSSEILKRWNFLSESLSCL